MGLTLILSLFIIILANGVSVAMIDSFLIFSFSPETLEHSKLINSYLWAVLICRVLPFPLALFATNAYFWPLQKHLMNKTPFAHYPEFIKIKLLNYPFVISSITLLSWILGGTLELLCSLYLRIPINFTTIFEITIFSLFLGGISFVISYYSLEYLQREFITPRLFPNGEIKLNRPTIKMDIQKKLFLFLISSVVLPNLIFYRFLSTLNNSGHNVIKQDLLTIIFMLCLGVIIISTLISNFQSYSIRKPILQMIQASKNIENGQFDIIIPVYSEDEIGVLSQRMNQMARGLKERETIKQIFGKIVDPKIRDYILNHSHQMSGEIKQVTVLFCDLEGFSTLSENKNPLEIVKLLNEYFEIMTVAITQEQGLVNKYIGDAILAVFGAPLDLENHADAALRAALKMQIALIELNKKLAKENKSPLRNRIGIHTGEVLAGMVGSSSRMEYTVIGDAVNIASRLEKVAKDMHQPILISEQTSQQLQGENRNVVFLNEVSIRGRVEPIKVYRKVS